jgi:hypothetical protein
MKGFKARLRSNAGNLFFEVPFDVREHFGRARPPLTVSLNGYSYRSTVAVYSGRYYLPVRREHREAAGLKAGDFLEVKLELDEAPRTVEAPPDLARALAKNAHARAAWKKLSYSHKREHAAAILGAKRSDTRERRVQKAIELLSRKKEKA